MNSLEQRIACLTSSTVSLFVSVLGSPDRDTQLLPFSLSKLASSSGCIGVSYSLYVEGPVAGTFILPVRIHGQIEHRHDSVRGPHDFEHIQTFTLTN